MTTRTLGTILLLLVVSAASVAVQAPAHAQSRTAYIALGDSIAHGVGSSLPERRGYPALVAELLEAHSGGRMELNNLAVPGETAATFMTNGQFDAFAERVGALAESGTALGVVSVSLGGNELLARRFAGTVERHQALADFRESFDEAIGRVRGEVGENTLIVLTAYYDLSEGDRAAESSDAWWVDQFNNAIRSTAERHGALVADVDVAFKGRVEQWTHSPYDVHPNNQGFRAIARQVWAALALDENPPSVRIMSAATALRRTPTLQVEVTDDVDVVEVTARVGNAPPRELLHTGDGRYVLLLDFREDDASEHRIVVTATDSAGNSSQEEQVLRLDVQ